MWAAWSENSGACRRGLERFLAGLMCGFEWIYWEIDLTMLVFRLLLVGFCLQSSCISVFASSSLWLTQPPPDNSSIVLTPTVFNKETPYDPLVVYYQEFSSVQPIICRSSRANLYVPCKPRLSHVFIVEDTYMPLAYLDYTLLGFKTIELTTPIGKHNLRLCYARTYDLYCQTPCSKQKTKLKQNRFPW
eukprot:Gb_13494 [translate_table: standard]